MATREQTVSPRESHEHAVNAVLTRAYTLNWEMIAYALIFVAALATRFIDLGVRVMSHDESLHTYYSWRLFEFGEFSHTPLMHGPLLFHMTALSYYLFGDSDFTARIYPAVLGVMVVLFPLLFRRWIGRVGAVIASVLLLISPQMLYYTRYIRHDIPTIFFALLMIYAIMQYLDGKVPRRPTWIVVMAGALLGMLASKEVAFIYIAIFGSFLVLYWLMRMVQDIGIRQHPANDTAWHAPIVQFVLGHVFLFVLVLALALPLSGLVRQFLLPRVWLPDSLPILLILLAVTWLPLALSGLVFKGRGAASAIMGALSNGRSALYIIVAGLILGAIISLLIICVIDVIKPVDVWPTSTVRSADDLQLGIDNTKEFATATDFDGAMFVRLLTWIGLPVLVMIFVVFVTAVARFPGDLPLPWREILLVILLAAVVTSVLVMFERRSFVHETSAQPFAADPTAAHVLNGDNYDNRYIVVTWVLGALLTAGIAASRLLTNVWDFFNRQPVFDLLIVIGTLILPWLAGFPLYWAGYNLEEYNINIQDGRDTVEAAVITVLPFLMVAAAVGLSWNWRRWLPAALVFLGLFAFFFTTIFSNQNGLITGMIGSLGYWLEQQGVRRGSQPQYYYVLTQLPVYEFLPLIGALGASVLGLNRLWDWRRERTRARVELRQVVHSAYRTAAIPAPGDQPAAPDRAVAEVHDSHARLFAPYDAGEEQAHRASDPEWIGAFPFLLLAGWWAIAMLLGLTVAGEKMPWLTTHLTLPLALVAGWWLGQVVSGLRWESIRRGEWLALFVLLPAGIVALAHVVLGIWGDSPPFSGRDVASLTASGNWIAALLIVTGVAYVVGRFGQQWGVRQLGRLVIVSGALVLAVLTARVAYLAAYINYDYATEYLVYAHAGPAVKTVMDEVDHIATLTNEGTNMRIVFDDESSWPFTWYFRHYTNYSFMRGEAGSVDPTSLDGARVVVVGNKKAGDVRRILGDRYYEFDYFRLWWPMQEYFNLTYARVANIMSTNPDNFAAPYYRQGLWDIWWNRDYDTYAQAMCIDTQKYRCDDTANPGLVGDERDQWRASCERSVIAECAADEHMRFDVDRWPVSDRMYFFVDKQIAAQVWDAGIGSSTVNIREPEYAEDRVYMDVDATDILDAGGELLGPRGVAVGPDDLIYVADTDHNRIVVLDQNGALVRTIGGATVDGAPAILKQPWGLDFGPDGNLYVADTWNNRVAVFTPDGEFLRAWGHEGVPGSDPSTDAMWGPRELAIGPNGNVYVADTGGKRVRAYTPEGEWLRDIGMGGSAPGQLDEPVGLAFNPVSDELYIAEAWNQRVSVFDTDGMFLRSFGVNMWFRNRQSFNRPYLTVSPDGTLIYVTDMDDRQRVVAYNLSGVPVFSFDQPDNLETGVLGLRSPAGMAFDDDGRLVVVDADQAKLFVFPPTEIRGGVAPVPGDGAVMPFDSGQEPGAGDDLSGDLSAGDDLAEDGEGDMPGEFGAIPPPDAPTLQAGSLNATWSPVIRTVDDIGMMYVPGGCFFTADDARESCVSPFWISRTEITNAQYAACVEAGACSLPRDTHYYDNGNYRDAPVVLVTWEQAREFATWFGGRLPTEAEWEYAAAGPEGLRYPWGDLEPTCGLANSDGCGGLLPVGGTQRVAGQSWIGAVDLSGSVWEWTADRFAAEPYADAESGALDPAGPASEQARTVRGGAWLSPADALAIGYREGRNPVAGYETVGLRVVLPADAIADAAVEGG